MSVRLVLTRVTHVLIRVFTQYKGGMFKIALLDCWLLVVNGKQLTEELHRFPDDHVSLADGNGEVNDWVIERLTSVSLITFCYAPS